MTSFIDMVACIDAFFGVKLSNLYSDDCLLISYI